MLLLLFTKKKVYLMHSSHSLMMSLTERMWSRLRSWLSGGYCICELNMDRSWEPLDRGLIGTWGGVNVISSCIWPWPAEVLAEVASYSPRIKLEQLYEKFAGQWGRWVDRHLFNSDEMFAVMDLSSRP